MARRVEAGRAQHGFTLIEMLVVVVVLAVLLTLGVPSYQRLVVDSRMTTQANEFLTMLYFARSEAIKRNATVTVCKWSTGTACATSGTWAQGWMAFVDTGTIGTVDGPDSANILRVHGALTGGSTFKGRNTFGADVSSFVSYLSNGQSSPQTGRFNLCSPQLDLNGRDIRLAVGGRPFVLTDVPPLSC